MLDGLFNDVNSWEYSSIPGILKAGRGFNIKTEENLNEALQLSSQYTEDICILDVQIDPDDTSLALKRMTKAFARRI
jgi:indolepyruvate decarboxylase